MMNDEKFELTISDLAGSGTYYADIADELRARDTAQREALARVEAERDLAVSQRDHNLYSARLMTEAAEEAQAQLAEAVGLLNWLKIELDDFPSLIRVIDKVLARHAQAEQQEAQGAQAGDERAAFEDEFDRRGFELDRLPSGAYLIPAVRFGWEGWEARAALATQPAAGEPVAWVEPVPLDGMSKDYYRGFGHAACQALILNATSAPPAATPVAAGEPVAFSTEHGALFWHGSPQDWKGKPVQLYLAPPATAHGDEAVRKDAERLDFILTKCRKVVVEMLPRGRDVYVEEGVMGERTYPAIHRDKDWAAGSAEEFAIKRQAIDAAMRAQAGEGGE